MGFVNTLGILTILAGAPAVGFLADLSGHFRNSFILPARSRRWRLLPCRLSRRKQRKLRGLRYSPSKVRHGGSKSNILWAVVGFASFRQ